MCMKFLLLLLLLLFYASYAKLISDIFIVFSAPACVLSG